MKPIIYVFFSVFLFSSSLLAQKEIPYIWSVDMAAGHFSSQFNERTPVICQFQSIMFSRSIYTLKLGAKMSNFSNYIPKPHYLHVGIGLSLAHFQVLVPIGGRDSYIAKEYFIRPRISPKLEWVKNWGKFGVGLGAYGFTSGFSKYALVGYGARFQIVYKISEDILILPGIGWEEKINKYADYDYRPVTVNLAIRFGSGKTF
jgi:hypothetical protein